MTFVIYDVETSGLNKRFDQILQFAAVRTDASLHITDRFEVRARLMEHIVPSPVALNVNGSDIVDLLKRDLPSHYEAVCAIAAKLRSWSPAVFLGYNSIHFDEEFLRQAFYLCLHPPFLTNTDNNTRADVLNLVRAAASLAPGALRIPVEEGRPCFRLAALAQANGFCGGAAHDAANDVEATLHICRLVAERAPDLWSRFLRFAQRRVVSDFLADEEAFVYFDQVGSLHSTHIVADIGASPTRPTLHFCVDLKTDLEALAGLDTAGLADAILAPPRPIRRMRVNAAPTLIPLYEAPSELLEGRTEEDYVQSAHALRDNHALVARLRDAAIAGERVYPESPHVEEQIYSGGFATEEQAVLLREFHTRNWELRRDLAARFSDKRHRALAIRLFFLERPDLLDSDHRARIAAEVARRRRGQSQEEPVWLTVADAQAELNALHDGELSQEARARLANLRTFLNSL